MKKPYLEAGEFVTTHGVAGEMRLYPHADEPAFLMGFARLYLSPEGGKELKVESVRVHKNVCLVKLAGIDTVAAARPLIGRAVYIARADAALPEGRFFVQDLLGARVEDARTGRTYGTVKAVTHPGRHDVYEIDRGADTVLFPATGPFVESIDIDGGVVKVLPIEGMFPEDPPPEEPPRPAAPEGGGT